MFGLNAEKFLNEKFTLDKKFSLLRKNLLRKTFSIDYKCDEIITISRTFYLDI
jgi:hypothetical protein